MSSITLWGAVYDTDHVDLPKTGGGTVRFSEGGGGGSGYTRTVIVPQQTVTPTYADGVTEAVLSVPTGTLVAGGDYIITFDGNEFWFTCIDVAWGGFMILGAEDLMWGTSNETNYPCLIYDGYADDAYLKMRVYDGYNGTPITIKVEKIELTGSGGGGSATLITKTITANGTYSASDDSADGYSSVTVNVPSSAASSWTKVAETSYQVSTTSTSSTTVATWATGHSELWTSDKIVYVRVRDTAGKRTGYFYGVDAWVINRYPKNPSLSTYAQSSDLVYQIWMVNSNGEYAYRYGYNTTGYGVYADTLYSDGSIRIRARYNSSSSRTIDGTYKVEVYLLDPAGGVPIFE